MTATDVTAPITVTALDAKVALLERFQPGDGWLVQHDPALGRRWVLEWSRARLVVGDLGDLRLARVVVEQRLEARHHLRRTVVRVAEELALPRARLFRHPATNPVGAVLTRCPGCGCNVIASTHRPGSPECHIDAYERAYSRENDR